MIIRLRALVQCVVRYRRAATHRENQIAVSTPKTVPDAESHPGGTDAALADGPAHAAALWNPTGNAFDLRPDLADMSMAALAEALLGLRRMLATPNLEFDRRQVLYFERLYSAALWQHVIVSQSEATVMSDGLSYDILPTPGQDVYFIPAGGTPAPSSLGAGLPDSVIKVDGLEPLTETAPPPQ